VYTPNLTELPILFLLADLQFEAVGTSNSIFMLLCQGDKRLD